MNGATSMMWAWCLIIVAAINSTLGNLLLKKSRENLNLSLIEQLFNGWFIGGLLFYGINVILFAKALEKLPVSVAYPVLAGIGFLLLTVSASWMLGEKIAPIQIFGIGLILFGVFLLAKTT